MKRSTASLMISILLLSKLSGFASACIYPPAPIVVEQDIQVVSLYKAPKVGIPTRREGAGTR